MQRKYLAFVAILIIQAISVPCWSTNVEGVLSLSPVGEQSCIAVEVLLPPGQALSSVRWYHNDGTVAFPSLLLMEGTEGAPPSLAETAMFLEQLGAESLAWGEAELDEPVVSSTGVIYAVFMLPPYEERTGEGTDGGPGIGYRLAEGGPRTYVSHDGTDWLGMHPSFTMAVEPVTVSMKRGATVLASLRAEYTEESPTGISRPVVTELLPPRPNPFNPSAEIRFNLERRSKVALTLYNVRGQQVRLLTEDVFTAGRHSVTWLGRDDRGESVSSGVYLVRMEADGRLFQQRMVLLR